LSIRLFQKSICWTENFKSQFFGPTISKVEKSNRHFQKSRSRTDIFKSRVVGRSDNSTFDNADTPSHRLLYHTTVVLEIQCRYGIKVPFAKQISHRKQQAITTLATYENNQIEKKERKKRRTRTINHHHHHDPFVVFGRRRRHFQIAATPTLQNRLPLFVANSAKSR
jgi:hypothetical protein